MLHKTTKTPRLAKKMEEITTLIGNYAFPIIMCLWFMFRTEKVMAANTKATEEMILILRNEQAKEEKKNIAS